MTAALRLEVLGGLRITLDGVPVTGFVSRKVEALLCYLAVERRSHPRSSLTLLLWGDLPEADAAANLRQALSNLRRLLDPFLVITRHTVELSASGSLWLDSAAFASTIAGAQRSDLPALHTALELYRGDFLAGFWVRDAPAFDEWALTQRERLREHALEALHLVARHAVEHADYAAGIQATTRLLTLDPWREEAHRQLMWLYIRSGQRSAAIAQFQACQQILAQELGVEPMRETTALHERIKAAQALRPHPVQQPAQPLVGRHAEYAALTRLIASPGSRLAVITGLGGSGKTRLAQQIALEWAPRFLHGVRVVALATVSSADRLIAAIAAAVGCNVQSDDNAQEQLLKFFEDKDVLLVLDNFEQLIEPGAELVVELLQRAPDVKLLVTSRERLQLQDEAVITLQGLPVPPAAQANALETYDSVQLFVQQARKLAHDFVPGSADMLAVARICRLVEGLPLGIELAAGWVRVLSCAEIAEEIERNLEFLATSLRDVPARHRSLRAVFDHSWQLLSEAERRALRQLTVFRGGFTRDGAAAVVGGSVAILLALVDQSLLRMQTTVPCAPRYDMHDQVWHYAREKLGQAEELDAAQARHLAFCVQLAETAEPELSGALQTRWIERLECEHDNLRSALQWALEHQATEAAARLCGALWRFWWMRGYLREGSQWLEQTLAQLNLFGAGSSDHLAPAAVPADTPQNTLQALRSWPELRAQVLHGAGVLMHEQGKYEQAQAHYQASLALRREQGNKRGVAASLNSLGVVALDRGDYARAEELYGESLALKRELGNQAGIAVSLNNLALVMSARGNFAQAQTLYQESLALCYELADKDGVATALGNLAALALQQDQPEQALRLFGESLTLRRELGDQEGIAECLEGLAGVAGAYGRQPGWMQPCCQKVARLYGAAEALRDQIGAPMTPLERVRYVALTSAARSCLGEVEFAAAWAAGRALSLDEAIADGLDPRFG